jgi:DNA-binding MarR family transcriptional regulator
MNLEEHIKSTSPITIEKKIVLNVLLTQHLISEKMNEVLKPFDLSVEQFNVLRILRGQKGKPSNMCMIQERMIAKTSNTTRLVDKLLAKELVTREVCEQNRRKMEISITAKGQSLLLELDNQFDAIEKSFSAQLTPTEQYDLNQLLEKFRNFNTTI